MVQRQFKALSARLHGTRVLREVATVPRVREQVRRVAPVAEVRRWLFNAWNTENLLRLTSDLLGDEANASALQWSFPQAYYSAFALTLAYFKAAGYTEEAHRAVIKKFGREVLAGEYPPALSFAADGPKDEIKYIGLDPARDESALALDASNSSSVDKHIAQALAGTRRQSLDERKEEMQFKTVIGTRKKRLSAEDWSRVSDKVGPTSLLSLLYRKRIQANYKDIETLAFAGANAATTHDHLLRVTTAINFIHECLVAATIGWSQFQPLLDEFLTKCPMKRLELRRGHIEQLCA